MLIKTYSVLWLVAALALRGHAQTLQYSERLSSDDVYVGDNTLQLDVVTLQQPYTYSFPNLSARLDRRQEQFILMIPDLEPDLADSTIRDTMTPEEADLLTRLLYVERSSPLIIRLFFPPNLIDLSTLEGENTLESEVQMGGQRYQAPAQTQVFYQGDQMIISFSILMNVVSLTTPRGAAEEIQLYAQGVRLAGEPTRR